MEKPKRKKSWQETSLSEYLESFISELGPDNPVAARWDEIIGPEMKDNVTLESIDETSLVVRCTHPAFSNYFRIHQTEVLSRLNAIFPSYRIRKVRVLI